MPPAQPHFPQMTAPPAVPDTQHWQQQQMAQMATPGGVSVMQPHIPDAAGIRPQQQMPEVATSEGHGQQFHQTQGQGWERDQRHSQTWDQSHGQQSHQKHGQNWKQDQRYGQNWDQSHGQQSHQRQSQNWEQDQRHGQNWEQAPRTSAASTPRKAVPPNVAFQISKSLSTILRHK